MENENLKSKNSGELLSSTVEIQTRDIEMSFFYTNDKEILALDTTNLINDLIKKYPNFSPYSENEQLIKQTFLDILNDDKFVKKLLKTYDITIYDFFKELYTTYFNIFKGPFIKKIQAIIKTKIYCRKNAN